MKSQLIVLDIQGKLAQIVHQHEEVIRNSCIAINGCRTLDIPIVWVEQLPEKLGATHPDVANALSGITPLSKSSFSAMRTPSIAEAVRNNNHKQVILIGIETHICIYQTAVDLISLGYEVLVLTDAVSSRTESNKAIGLTMLQQAGAKLFSTEGLVFELLGDATHPKFKEIAKLVK